MIVVLADDLSGAAEIGGVAWRYGLTAEIQHELDATADVDLIVVNTDARAHSCAESARRVEAVATRCRAAGIEQIFFKVDSVLRGHVLANLAAAMAGLGRQRALLAPANPGLGRTITHGIYRVDNISLHETQFAHDPDFPATTASVTSLLQERSASLDGSEPRLSAHAPGMVLPAAGIIAGDATHSADLTKWAEAIDAATLPAGAAEFFAAFLCGQGCEERSPAPPHAYHLSPHLFVCGSASVATRQFFRQSAANGLPLLAMPQALFSGDANAPDELLDKWAHAVVCALQDHQRAIVAIDQPITHVPSDPARLTHLLNAVVARTLAGVDVKAIFVEGGATAAALTHALGWSTMRVEKELAPGVVCTRPVRSNAIQLTMKPGSYSWPSQLLRPLNNAD